MPDQPAGTARRPQCHAPQRHATAADRDATEKTDRESLPGAADSAGFDIGAWVRQSRERQGLPAKIEDVELLAKVARFLLESN